jgi:hypothetical protein
MIRIYKRTGKEIRHFGQFAGELADLEWLLLRVTQTDPTISFKITGSFTKFIEGNRITYLKQTIQL